MRTYFSAGLVALAVTLAGCGKSSQPSFGDLHPTKGVVKRGGQPANGGVIYFATEPPNKEFLINSEVGADGTYSLTTVRTTDKEGERKPGAPAGTYRVTYQPPLGDQTAGGQVEPIVLRTTVTVKAGDNNITIDVPKK